MRHVVFWVPEADEKLQAIITAANAATDLIRVVREIDYWLARDPLDFGESRFDTVRLGVVRPLAVLFDVLEDPPTVIESAAGGSVWGAQPGEPHTPPTKTAMPTPHLAGRHETSWGAISDVHAPRFANTCSMRGAHP